MVEAFSKEKGVRKISYAGDGRFMLDYEISGTLDHGFVFPFNTDAEVAVPFIAIELRKDGVARVKAPGFVGSARQSPIPRSEERRVGKECVSTCRYRWSRLHYTKHDLI